ncbi:MAG: hypothetical protein IT260_09380 [Saprospiraceae bacterium]|nr:hypothetical protein [Saprospiraceae bacterium]
MKKKLKKKLALVKIPLSHLDAPAPQLHCQAPAGELSQTCPGTFTCTCTAQHQCGPSFTCPNRQ